MNSNITLNFHLEMASQDIAISLMRLAIGNLEILEKSGIEVEYFELRLQPMEQGKKKVYIKIDGDNRTFIETDISFRWDSAFLAAFERILEQFVQSEKRVNPVRHELNYA
ncbi:MAG TPA: hypothetical protein VNE41_11610 [Chitinophagaceae bacterium]|nr:hypothetical protein [Chitinophagaceae bacterium]